MIYSYSVISHPYTSICLFVCIMYNPLFWYFWCCFIIFLILRQATFLWNCSNKSPNWQYFSKSTYYFSINFHATEQPSWGNTGPVHTESLLWLLPSSQLCHQTVCNRFISASVLHILFTVFIPMISDSFTSVSIANIIKLISISRILPLINNFRKCVLTS